jgi:hypothetical protein
VPETVNIEIERLCEHHVTEDFDCGDNTLNLQLGTFQRRFENGGRVLGFVARGDTPAVLAYVILHETVFEVPSDGRRLRCFVVPAMAVATEWQGSSLFTALVQRALIAMAARQEAAIESGGERFRGLVCMPGANKVLRRYLLWADFKPFGSEGLYWLPLGENFGDVAEGGEPAGAA